MDRIESQLEQINEQLRLLRQDIARDYLPRSDFIRRRRQFFLTLGVVVGMLLAGGWVTQRMTLASEHRILTECFLRPARLGPVGVEHCTQRFGRDYAELQAQSAQAQKVFVDLQRRVDKLEQAQKR